MICWIVEPRSAEVPDGFAEMLLPFIAAALCIAWLFWNVAPFIASIALLIPTIALFFRAFADTAFELFGFFAFTCIAQLLNFAFGHFELVAALGVSLARFGVDALGLFHNGLCFFGTTGFLGSAGLLLEFLEFVAYVITVVGANGGGKEGGGCAERDDELG